MITNAVTLEQGVTVTQLKGQIYLVAADGSRKLLAEGDVLPKGAVIMSPDGASFMGGGQSFTVQPASEQSEPAEEGDAPQLAQNGAAGTPDDINALQQAILGGADPTQAFEASAAGGAPAAGGGGIGGVAGASGNGGFVTIDRTGSATIAEATFDTTYNTNGEPPLGAVGVDEVFDLTPPTISVVAPDNTNDTTPTLTGTTDAPVGSIVTLLVTDANGNQQTLTATVTPAGTFTVDVVTPLAEGSYTVTATVTDPAGNTGSATDSGSVDVTAPVITVDAPDNTNDTTPTITGTTNAVPGITVTLVVTDANGTQQTLTATVQPGGGYSVDVTTPLAEGSYQVTASVTDPAGNTGTATDDGSVDVTAPTITVDAPDNSNDTTPTITGTTDAPAGSTVTLVVTDANGNPQTLTATVQPGGGYSVDVTTPLAEGSYQVTASVTDPAGNTGTATDDGSVDTVAPELGIDLDPIVVGGDNIVNKAEADDKASVTLSGTVSGDVKVDDTVILTLGDGSKLETKVVDLGNGQLGFSTSTTADKLVGGNSITAEISVTDAAGNSATKSDTKDYTVDNVAAPAPIVELQGAGDDNTYNKDEIGSDNSVTAKVTLTAGTQVGDLLVVTNGAGGELFRGEVTAEMLKDGLTVEVPVVGTPDEIKVTAQVTDQAGNPSALAEDKAGVDNVAAPAPTVVIVDDANNDQLLTKAEIGNDSIQVMVQVNAADLTAGGKVNLSITNGNTTSNVELKLVDGKLVDASGKEYGYSNGTISWTEPRPVDGGQLKVDATQTDKAGNTSDKGGDQATVIYASDDSFAEQEDQLVTGQLLTNDHSSNTSIVSFTVMYNGTLTSFNAGQTVALSIGSLLIQANGEFKFIPNQHWSGDVPTVTYTTNTGDTATLNITVQPVADKPLVDVILTANGTPLYSGFISSGITTEQFRNGDFTQQPFNTGAKQTDASSGQDTVYGSNGNDHMVSTNGGGDHLLGYAGNDVLVGGDAIQGDTIDGGIGNDILVAGLGQDSLYGGEGNDIAVLMGNRADYIITKDYRHSQWDNWFNFTTIEHGQTITKALHDIEYIQFDDGIYELDKNTGELVMVQPTYVDYPVEIHASLTDRDGSELLDSIELSGLPAGTQVFYNGQLLGVADNAGKLLLDYNGPNGWSGGNLWSENALDATLTGVTIRIPGASAGQVDLVIEAVAREKGTDLTNSATGEDAIRLDYFKGTEGEPGDQNVNFGSEHNIVVGDLDGSIVLPGQNYNIAFMVDSSGSIGEKALDAMEAQLKLVFNSLKASAMEEGSGTVKVFLVDFDGRAKSWVSVDLKDPNAISTLENALKEMTVGGNTNYEDVFKTTANWFSDIDGNSATNLAYFITDGQANQYNYNEGQNPVVYDPRGANNSIDLSTIIQNGYVFGNTYSQDGRMIINQYGEVLKWTQNNNNSWSSSSVGFMRPDGNGGFQFANLGTNGTGANANSQQGFAFLSTMGVIVQAIGIGPSLDRDDLKPFDSDGNVLTNINAGDLADAILGDQVNAIPGSDRFDGGAGDDIIFGDAIHFTGISGQGYAAIKAYVADKISINEVSDAQVHRYIGEHSDEFDRSGSNDKADTLFGGAGNDILFGQGGNDELYGNDGKDILYGGTGSDKLYGGLGNDILTGGEGKDFFVWNQGDASASKPAVDVITDFNKMANNTVDLNQKDVIDLSELLDSDGGKSEASLKGLLSIFEDSGKVRLEVRDDTPQHNLMQTIVLEGHSFASLTGNTYTDKSQTSQVIDYMLLNNMLEIDKPHG